MTAFTPCKGLAACRDDGRSCLTCGRDLGEIARLRDRIDGLAGLAIEHGSETVESYTSYVAEKVAKKVRHRRQQAEG